MASFAATYNLQEKAWAQAADMAVLRMSLKQVLAENEMLRLRVLDVKSRNIRAAELLMTDHPGRNFTESAPLPVFAPPSPCPPQSDSHAHLKRVRDD